MDETHYVPFEPGIGIRTVMTPGSLAARVVAKVPEVSEIKGAAPDVWFDAAAVDNLRCVRTRKPADPRTRVAIFRDPTHLFVAFDCIEPRMDRIHRLVPRDAEKGETAVVEGVMPRMLDYDENVKVLIDYHHDRTVFYGLQVNVNGARKALHLATNTDWTVFAAVDWREMEGLAWESEVCERGDGWRAAISVDLASIGIDLDARPTMGLELVRLRHVGCWRAQAWGDLIHQDQPNALAFGDLYLGASGVRVRRIDWGDREYGSNRMKVTVASKGKRRVTLRVRATSPSAPEDDRHEVQTGSPAVDIPASGEGVLEVDYVLPHDRPLMQVTVELADADSGDALYRATYPLRDHAGVRIHKPYARVAREGAANPKPDDPRFHEKKLEWVLSRLPRFTRRTTAQGAPSDFTLAAADDSVEFNLMESGALKRIADWIGSLFDNDVDRLVAVALFTNDDWVTVHAAARVAMHHHLTPLSQLRLGCGHCYSRAAVGAGIVHELVDPATGVHHEAWPTLVLGHVITAVERGGDCTFIDPTFGHFFFNADNSDLATSAELAADHALITRVVKGANRLANYIAPQAHVRLDEGTVVWPAGAPPK